MKSEVLKGFEFIEPIISDVRSKIELKYHLSLSKDEWKVNQNDYGENISKLGAIMLSNQINKFLIETGGFSRMHAHTIQCEMRHSMHIHYVLWAVKHDIVELKSADKTLYIDPLMSMISNIYPEVNDVYIGETIPDYYIPIDLIPVREDNFLARLDKKLQITRKVPKRSGCDIDGDVVNVFGIPRFTYHLQYKVGFFEYLEYHVRGKICNWIRKHFL